MCDNPNLLKIDPLTLFPSMSNTSNGTGKNGGVYDPKNLQNNHDNTLVKGFYTFEEIGGGGGGRIDGGGGVRDLFEKNDLLLLDSLVFFFLLA